jgi:uncharacterized RDD family membrane protein YckC
VRRDEADAPAAGSTPPLPAGLAWRAGCRVVDIVVALWLIAVVSVEIESRLLGFDPAEGGGSRLALVTVLAVALLEVVPVAVWGRSLGKAAFGLRVVTVSAGGDVGQPPGVARALARTTVLYAPLAAPLWGVVVLTAVLVPVVLDRFGRGLHDRLAGTMVVSSVERSERGDHDR